MSDFNPLLMTWTTPFGVPPFDLIRPEHFQPALDATIAAHLAEIAAIGAETRTTELCQHDRGAAAERNGRWAGSRGCSRTCP